MKFIFLLSVNMIRFSISRQPFQPLFALSWWENPWTKAILVIIFSSYSPKCTFWLFSLVQFFSAKRRQNWKSYKWKHFLCVVCVFCVNYFCAISGPHLFPIHSKSKSSLESSFQKDFFLSNLNSIILFQS